MSNDVRGQFVWYELMTTDPKAAQDFYGKIVGWAFQSWDGAGMPYTMLMADCGPLGGLMQLPAEAQQQGAPPHWVAYIGTPSVDATADRARSLGATVLVPPTDIPNVGRFAMFKDPQGAVFAAFTPANAPAQQPDSDTPRLKEVSWHELLTTDHEAALRFYSELFGWTKTEAMDMGPGGVYQMYGAGKKTLGGMFNKPPEVQAPPHWLLYFHVADVHKGAEQVKALGGKVLNGPMEVPGGGWIVQCLDPQGAGFALHHHHGQGQK